MSHPDTEASIKIILEKLEEIERILHAQQSADSSQAATDMQLTALHEQLKSQTDGSINGFFSGKEQMVKDQVRKFMLDNFNIEALNDNIEGEIYDFIVDKVWELTVGRFI